ncbi:MAG: hypothetical protein OER85_11810 [Gammaproteobacteria bacterium]|nr:hypothetical protein [Gammaproteobacteria bacterium]
MGAGMPGHRYSGVTLDAEQESKKLFRDNVEISLHNVADLAGLHLEDVLVPDRRWKQMDLEG